MSRTDETRINVGRSYESRANVGRANESRAINSRRLRDFEQHDKIPMGIPIDCVLQVH